MEWFSFKVGCFSGLVITYWLELIGLNCAAIYNVNNTPVHCCWMTVKNTTSTTVYGDCTDSLFTDSNQKYIDWTQRFHSLCIANLCFLFLIPFGCVPISMVKDSSK